MTTEKTMAQLLLRRWSECNHGKQHSVYGLVRNRRDRCQRRSGPSQKIATIIVSFRNAIRESAHRVGPPFVLRLQILKKRVVINLLQRMYQGGHGIRSPNRHWHIDG